MGGKETKTTLEQGTLLGLSTGCQNRALRVRFLHQGCAALTLGRQPFARSLLTRGPKPSSAPSRSWHTLSESLLSADASESMACSCALRWSACGGNSKRMLPAPRMNSRRCFVVCRAPGRLLRSLRNRPLTLLIPHGCTFRPAILIYLQIPPCGEFMLKLGSNSNTALLDSIMQRTCFNSDGSPITKVRGVAPCRKSKLRWGP